jgi:EAL and modified HD-GYP domain-containing signal transduction protein
MAGLITGVGALLGLPPAEMINQLPLSSDIASALVDDVGPLARVIRVADAYERGDLDELERLYGQDLAGTFIDALRWSTHTIDGAQLTPRRIRRAEQVGSANG